MREPVLRTALGATLALALTGCHDASSDPAAQTAEKALGVNPSGVHPNPVQATKDVTVVEETKVIDNATGKTISDTTKSTPVKITEEKKVTTDVKVNVGEPATTKK